MDGQNTMPSNEQNLYRERRIFSENMRRMRFNMGITQTALAEAVGLSRAQICNLEAGRGDVVLSTAAMIADVLGVELWSMLRE